MKVISVNVGRAEPLEGGKTGKDAYLTGIYKRPAAERIVISKAGLAGDHICNETYHGGADQAVYLYGWSDYAWWGTSVGRSLPAGTFGENLTISELDHTRLCIGDRFRIGGVVLEVSAPRVPCSTLSRRMADSAFLKKFRMAERPGAYCRVIDEGEVQTGDAVSYEPIQGEGVSLLEIYRAEFVPSKDPATLRRHLASPIAERIRAAKEEQLAKIEAAGAS